MLAMLWKLLAISVVSQAILTGFCFRRICYNRRLQNSNWWSLRCGMVLFPRVQRTYPRCVVIPDLEMKAGRHVLSGKFPQRVGSLPLL